MGVFRFAQNSHAGLGTGLKLNLTGLLVYDVARNSSKPGRPAAEECWVLHGTAQWSEEHLEAEAEQVRDELLQEFWKVSGIRSVASSHVATHRWRYAWPPEPLKERCIFDAAYGLGACGDWCSGPRVEGAFLSGMAAAGCVLRAAASGAWRSMRAPSEDMS